MKRSLLVFLIGAALVGCGDPAEVSDPPATSPATSPAATPPPTASDVPPAAPVATPDPAQAPAAGVIYASVQVVDLQGTPLPGMAPIVTRQPNAFDKPVSMGAPTDAQGNGTIRFETGEHLYLRAWDPNLAYFPNNFYEVLPGGGAVDGVLVIQMVAASRLEAQLFLPDGQPAAGQTVALMLYHPTRGPWWPAEATADAEGAVRFPNLPAGEFVFRFKVDSGPQLEYQETPLPPATDVNLGALTLQ